MTVTRTKKEPAASADPEADEPAASSDATPAAANTSPGKEEAANGEGKASASEKESKTPNPEVAAATTKPTDSEADAAETPQEKPPNTTEGATDPVAKTLNAQSDSAKSPDAKSDPAASKKTPTSEGAAKAGGATTEDGNDATAVAAAAAAAAAAKQPPIPQRPLTFPEKLNWVDEILVGQLNELPKPLPSDSDVERNEKLHKVINTLVPEHRPFYNMYQFHQYVGRGLWPWGYHVRLDRADQFLHCYPAQEGTGAQPFSILFRFQPYSHQFPKERRHVYVVHIYHDDLGRDSKNNPFKQESKDGASSKATAAKPLSASAPKVSPKPTKRPTGVVPLSSIQREWNKMYEKLKEYKAKTGHTKVPARYKEDRQLGRWVIEQRFNYNNNRLAQDRVERLNEIGFTWKLRWVATAKDRDVSPWQDKFDRLKAFKKTHGTCLVPMNYPEDQALANWIATQRHKYRENRLSKEELDLLDGIGFIWQVRKDYRETAESWEAHLIQLSRQKDVNNVDPKQFPALAEWARSQRVDFKRGELNSHRQGKLAAIGFQFDDGTWDRHYQSLVDFHKKNGHTDVPESGQPLYSWVSQQRRTEDNLSQEQKKKLLDLGFTFSKKTATPPQDEEEEKSIEEEKGPGDAQKEDDSKAEETASTGKRDNLGDDKKVKLEEKAESGKAEEKDVGKDDTDHDSKRQKTE